MIDITDKINRQTYVGKTFNQIIEIPINNKTTNQNEHSINFVVQRYGDKCTFKHMVFYMKKSMSIDEFKNDQKDSFIVVESDYLPYQCSEKNIYTKLQLSMLMELTPVINIINDSTFVVTIPHYVVDDLHMYLLDKHLINVTFSTNSSNSTNLNNLKLFCQFTYLSDAYLTVPHKFYNQNILLCTDTQCFDNHNIIKTNLTECVTNLFNKSGKSSLIDFSNELVIKGCFIESSILIDEIDKLTIRHNGSDLFDIYDQTMINLYCKKISNNLLYVPIDSSNNENYKEKSDQSYFGSIEYSQNNHVDLIAGFKKKIKCDDVKIYTVYRHKINYNSILFQ